MPWEEKVIVTMREEFVKRVLSHEKSKSELYREYGISRPTGDKWIERYLNGQPPVSYTHLDVYKRQYSLSPICRKTEGSPTNLSIPTTFSKAHPSFTPHQPFHNHHPSFSRYSSSNIHFLPVYP